VDEVTPTQRTKKELRSRGLECDIAERYLQHAIRGDGGRGVRKDLFGIIDIIALDPYRGVVGVQSTGQAFSDHFKKITIEKKEEAIKWLCTPGAVLELWGWRKLKGRWQPRIHVFCLHDLLGY
jgi:hypothetical protein